ncbi:hypothetical protein M5689_006139 [Euphorbia peplus]|nr:hypothetical protein M5689_006139 [Euphorbia peplus]
MATAASGGALLLLTNPASINSYFFNSYRNRRSFLSTITARRDESVNSHKFKFKFRDKKNTIYGNNDAGDGQRRRWWSDEPPFMEEDQQPLPSLFDTLWILKLSKFYGWILPPMIISTLIATGLKTFLVVFSLSLGQSILSFAFQKLTGTTRSKPRPRPRARKRRKQPFVTYPGNVGRVDKEEGNQENVEGNGVPRSWVVNDDGSVKNEKTGATSFGGWDEMDGMESMRRRIPRQAAPNGKKPSMGMGGKLGKRREESDAPLLLRLLIAVFPFLASWTNML